MSRLPVPGSDDDVWGQILNDFLSVGLNSDGTLSTSAVESTGAYFKPNGGIPESDLSAAVQQALSQEGSGGVQISGDLGGTNTTPTVTGTHLVAALPVNQGGTGSTTQNFVDLSSDQSIAGTKTFSGEALGTLVDKGGATFNVKAYGVLGNGQRVSNVTSSSNSANISATGANFTNADVGKKAIVYSDSAGGVVTTIASVTDSTHLVLAANAGVTVSSTTGYMIYGTDDSAAIQSALNAAGSWVTQESNVTDANQPLGSGYVNVALPGVGPASYYILTNQITIPPGVIFDGAGTLANLLASRNEFCVNISPVSQIRRMLIENAFGTGVTCGISGQNSHIIIEDLRIWHTNNAPAAPQNLVATPSASGGTLAANTYFYTVLGVESSGALTAGSAEASATTTGSTGSVSLTWTAMSSAVSYRIYVGTRTTAEFHYATSGTNSFTDIGSGYTIANPIGAGTAVQLLGYHYEIGGIYIKTALWGIYHNSGADCVLDHAYLVGVINPIRTNVSNQIRYSHVFLDTCGGAGSLGGLLIENSSSDISAKVQAFGGTGATLSPVVGIGQISANTNTYIDIDVMANNLGGTLFGVSRAQDIRARIVASDAILPSGSTNPITVGVNYGNTLGGYLDIDAILSTGVTNTTTGTQYGTFRYRKGTSDFLSQTLNMSNNKITAVANGTAATDVAAFGQVPILDTNVPVVPSTPEGSAGSNGKASDSGHIHPRYDWTASDHSLLAWSFDPAIANATFTPISGTLYVIKVFLPTLSTITDIWLATAVGGSGFTAGEAQVALYNASGTLLSGSADQSASWTTAAVKTIALTTQQTNLPAGSYYVAIWAVASTMPTLRCGLSSALVNAGLNAANSRFATADTGLTNTPPGTLASLTAVSASIWVALN